MAFKTMRGNKYIELLSTNNKTLTDQWKMHSGVKKEYDMQTKTYVYNVSGNSPVAQMCLPRDKKQKLDLYYPLLALQLCFSIKANILCDIGITSCNSLRKRITLSSNQKSKQNKLLFTVLPFAIKNYNGWINVLVDIEEIVSDIWNLKVKGIDFLSLSGVFRLKRIFLLSRDFIHFQEGTSVVKYDQLPKQMSLSKNIHQYHVYISSSHHLLAESSRGETSESASDTIPSRNSSRVTSNCERFPPSEVIAMLKQERSLVTSFSNEHNYEKHCNTTQRKKFDLNLSMLTFSEDMNKIQEEFISGEISKTSSSDMCTRDLNKSNINNNRKSIELSMPLCNT